MRIEFLQLQAFGEGVRLVDDGFLGGGLVKRPGDRGHPVGETKRGAITS